MRLRDLTCPIFEMAAFNYVRGDEGVLAFQPSQRGQPTVVIFPSNGTIKTATAYDILLIKPKVGSQMAKTAGVNGLTKTEEVFLEVWYELLPYVGRIGHKGKALHALTTGGQLTQLFPNVFKTLMGLDKAKAFHYLTTQGLSKEIFFQYLGDVAEEQIEQHGERINNAVVFFPDNMRPKRKQMMVQFLDATHDVLVKNGLKPLFAGPITFTTLPGKTIGDWDHTTGQMRIQPNTQNDKTNFFTLIHEYGHKYWDTMMSPDQRQVVSDKYLELYRSGVGYQSEGGKLEQVYKAAEEIIKPGIRVQWIGRGKKFAGTWEVTSVFPWMDINRGFKTKKYSAKKIQYETVHSPTMSGPVAALLNDKKWKILDADVEDIPTLSSGAELKANIVSDQWFPTKYSETKDIEWWAELFGIHMLGNLKGEPAEFMNQVMGRSVSESRLDELYTPDVTYLKKFLSGGRELDSDFPRTMSSQFLDWIFQNGYEEVVGQLAVKEYGRPVDLSNMDQDKIEEFASDIWWVLPDEMRKGFQKEYGEEYLDYLMRNEPAMVPSTEFYSGAQLLKRQTWLVHFSDNAWDIASKGFKFGMDQMDQLGLTTYFKNEGFYKQRGGYNFAFQAGGRYANNAASEGKYGSEVVMFTNSGVKAYHSGDEEEQVIFWGANVDPRSIILITQESDDWCVSQHPSKGRFQGDCIYQNEDFNTVTNWVEQNWRQYAKIITGW